MIEDRIEEGVELLRELVGEHPELEAEFVASRSEFFGGELWSGLDELGRGLAARRHFEWFAFERPTGSEGVPAAHALFDTWLERADGELQLARNALLHSRSGIFEITEVEPGRGLWLNDLLGHAIFPVDEPDASAELAVGDLLAGRIFPVGESRFRLSPAAACFRNPDLRDAIRRDLERVTDGRRGTLRIAQIEIERMFFGRGGGRPAVGAGAAEAEALAAELTQLLERGGVERERAEAWIESLREAAEAAARVGEPGGAFRGRLLDALAFETEVDLERARELLTQAWEAFARGAGAAPAAGASTADGAPPPHGTLPVNGVPTTGPSASAATGETRPAGGETRPAGGETRPAAEGQDAVRRALANYDQGRAAGAGLDQLFEALERELGLDDEDGPDDEVAPDFPDVVRAMVVEYAWERERESRPLDADERALLMGLADRTRDVGVFELLSADHLVEFAARWALDRGLVRDAERARVLLAALEGFARWSDEAHDLELWSEFADLHAELATDLPRVAGANAALGVGELDVGDPRRFDVVEDLASGRVGVRDVGGEWRALDGPPAVLESLRTGDQVACRFEGDRALPLRCYPPAARRREA